MHMLQETLITFPYFKMRHNFFKNSFFPSTIIEWNNLDPTLRNSERFVDFKNSILKFIRPSPSNVFNCNNLKGIRLITRLHVGMSHTHEHKFKHNFHLFDKEKNTHILNATIEYILSTERFKEPLI